jgi:peptidoglycan L-alanyl-D-glutamate endopeptidase CwlK
MAREINQLHPRLQQKVAQLKEACIKAGLAIGIGDCYRSSAEQDALYAQGRSTPGNEVTNAKGGYSQHNWGIAFDFYRNDGTGAYNESGQFFEKVGAVGKSLDLGWGGDWTSIKDKPHFYLPDWGSTTSALRNQYGAPTTFMETWGGKTSAEPAPVPNKPSANDNTKYWIMSLQLTIGAKPDGIPGPETHSKCPTIKSGSRGEVVRLLQEWLNSAECDCGKADGIAGKNTDAGIRVFQRKHNLAVDGIAGKNTWRKVLGL